jgi:carboxynorspermidine decarboxylase
MQTQAGDPGAFAHFDLNRVPSPCFVVDEMPRCGAIWLTLARTWADRAGAKVLLALKAFSMWSLANVVGEYLDGVLRVRPVGGAAGP